MSTVQLLKMNTFYTELHEFENISNIIWYALVCILSKNNISHPSNKTVNSDNFK